MNKKLLLITLICVISSCMAFAQALKVPLLWDDEVTVSSNEFIRDWKFFPQIWTSHANRGGGEPGNFYRPLQDISFMLDYSLWKLNPFGYHLTNIIIHIINIILFIQILFIMFKGRLKEERMFPAIFFAAALFAVHPAISEGVIYVSARSTMLGALLWFCTFLSAVAFDKANRKMKAVYCFFGIVFFSAAVLTKESVLALPLTLAALAFCSNGIISRKTAFFWMALLFSVAGLRLALFWPFGPSHKTLSMIADASLYQRILTVPAVLAAYTGLLFFPFYLHLEHHFVIGGFTDYRLWVSVAVIAAVFAAVKRLYKEEKLCGFFGLAFFITLIPVLNIMPIDATIAETWLYLPSVWLFALGGYAVSSLIAGFSVNRRRFAYAFFIIYILILGVRTNFRIYTWRDALRLYLHDSALSPKSFVLANNTGVEYFRRGDINKAKDAFERAISINDKYTISHNNLGVVKERMGDFSGALAEYDKATQLSDYYLAYQNLGSLYRRMGLIDYAIDSCEKAARIFPENGNIRFELALCYYQAGRVSDALPLLQDIAAGDPLHPAAGLLAQIQKK